MAKAKASGEKGWGVFGVELFVLTDGSVLFNEISHVRMTLAWSRWRRNG